ncbi:MAG: hypothetical protein IJ524_05730 [Bacteroidales bacterium]|nr:hypothetical protein [Bacteroidales bacterium]
MKKENRMPKAAMLICVGIAFLFSFPSAQAQVRSTRTESNPTGFQTLSGSIGSRNTASQGPSNPFGNDSTYSQTDTSATKGLVFHKEVPDSVLRQKVFLFHHRSTHVWIDEVWSPTLDPTGAQFNDPLDAFNGNYYLGKGTLGHPHIGLFPTLAAGLQPRLQPDLYEGYAYTLRNIDFYQTLTPFSVLSYGGSLADDHSLFISHTQNIMPGWNAAFNYRLYNPEGVYASSGALNNYLSATTNYFSRDSRLQAKAALIWQSFNIDENGGLSNDSIFTLRLQSNRAGIPVVLSNSGSLQRNLAAMGSVSYSLERQSDTYRHRDSLQLVQVNDSTTRLDTLDIVDTIPLGRPHVLNPGIVGLELGYDRQKRVFVDSTHWREQTATLYWTNDAYASHRWRNPLKVTLGLKPRYLRAVIYGDTLRSYSWFNPFVRAEVALWRSTLTLEGEQNENLWPERSNRRLAATLLLPFDSAALTYVQLGATLQDKAPDPLLVYPRHACTRPANIVTEQYSLRFKHRETIDVDLKASHLNHNIWLDTALAWHTGLNDLWLLQASLMLRLKAGPMHLDMQQLLQHSTDQTQLPVPLWMSKNSLYADFQLFRRTLRMQTGVDVRYHTPYHAPLYDPATGLFLHQDELTVGGYLWADVFITMQVKRASIYLKAGHINALWENPATYFLLPHYPGQKFGVQWGLTWCFFD